MNHKLSLFTLCFLGISFLSQAQGLAESRIAPAASKKCSVFYYDNPAPNPDCRGPDGKPVQGECSELGPASVMEVLDKNAKSLFVPSWGLDEMEWRGYCHCTLYLYSKANYKGYSLKYPFTKSKAMHIFTSKLWRRPVHSFKVICTF